jgi:hypothetical protein
VEHALGSKAYLRVGEIRRIHLAINVALPHNKQSHYRPGEALRVSRRLRLPDFKTVGT